MRTLSVCLALALTACAGPPSPPSLDPVSHVPVRIPARNPYTLPAGAEWEPPVQIHTNRVERWTPSRHRAEAAAISTLVSVRIDPLDDVAVVTGPEGAAEAVTAFLSDRHRFEPARLRLVVHESRWPDDAWSFEALNRCDGALWAVLPREAAVAIARRAGSGFGALQLLEGDEVEHADLRQVAIVSACEVNGAIAGEPVLDPLVEAVTYGLQVRTTARLTADAELLVLDWICDRAAGQPEQASVAVGNLRGHTAVAVSLPRVHQTTVSERFVLRRDEMLALVQATPDGQDGVLITLVGWELERFVP